MNAARINRMRFMEHGFVKCKIRIIPQIQGKMLKKYQNLLKLYGKTMESATFAETNKVKSMSQVLQEITPLSEKDCFYVVERHKSEFLFPIHSHTEYELNFIENGAGVRRIVGDSVEEISDYELTLIGGKRLEHAWEQGNCRSGDVREITIQFSPDLMPETLLGRTQFTSIRQMFSKASLGLTFSLKAIMKVYALLDRLASETDGFEQYQDTFFPRTRMRGCWPALLFPKWRGMRKAGACARCRNISMSTMPRKSAWMTVRPWWEWPLQPSAGSSSSIPVAP